MWLVAGVVLVVVVGALAAFVVSRPNECNVSRTATVGAPSEVVFDIVNTLSRWPEWSPYDKRDPAMKRTITGPAAGPGASYAWTGNGKVGAGRMTVTDAVPGRRVTMDLQFDRPFKCRNVVNFVIEPAAGGSQVTWAMAGKNTLMGKAMSAVINMDKMVGTDFEQGLKNLDAVAKAEARSAVALG
jgi:hypothetical protein